jgi:hypothetical protein
MRLILVSGSPQIGWSATGVKKAHVETQFPIGISVRSERTDDLTQDTFQSFFTGLTT